ncbi:sensor histidine kinase [Nocardia donostiensis]|uniref:histidine kinase n=1 Tax=Nocardia donostiensis TaxID=1538463 RepID=A0A1V2TDZ2_9NOCA|nr:histidine kinase [Nocardia donostiensis]ONM47742.1 two-component sensor histidine kinase [Nocardia donostiensis]OQS22494.1 two-component sensor histidine kinase [Nocardia donostiensis]
MDPPHESVCCDEGVRYWSALSAAAQDALIAGVAFAIGAGLYLSGLYPMTGPVDETSLAVRFGLLALLCGVTLLRRRRPIWALVAGLVPLGIDIALGATLPMSIVYSDLIYAAVLYSTRRQSRFVVGTGVVLSLAAVGATLVVTGDWRVTALVLVIASTLVGTSMWWALSVRAHKETAQAERARAHALALVAELDRRAAVADERKMMARDLHDVIAGQLSAIAIQSEAALGVLARSGTGPELAPIIGSIRSSSVDALREMRTMIGLLRRDDGVADLAAPSGLAQLSRLVETTRATGTLVRVNIRADDAEPASAVDQAAYRIVQEALTNSMKHAPGQEISIDVSADQSTVTLSVRNTLPADRPPREPGNDPRIGHRGLVNMRERATALGGTFHAGAEPGGWAVHVRLPATPAAEPAEVAL